MAAWSSLTTYAINDNVTFSGKSYTSLQNANLNHQPDLTLGTWWTIPISVSKTEGFAVSLPQLRVSRTEGYAVSLPVLRVSKLEGYSVTLPVLRVSKEEGYAVSLPSVRIAKMEAYAVLLPYGRPHLTKASFP